MNKLLWSRPLSLQRGNVNSRSFDVYWDVNSMTWGTYLDSTSVPISEPNRDEILDSNVVLIFAAAYSTEIINMLKEYGYKGDVIRFDGSIQKISLG